MYEVKIRPQAAPDIKALPKNVRNHMREHLTKIVAVNPVDCSVELTGPLAGFRSYHLLEYRIVYKIFEDLSLVVVVGVGQKNADHCAEIYKNLEAMAMAGKLADSVLTNLRMLTPS